MIYNLSGIEFNAAEGEPCDFGYFTPGSPKANDTGQMGMVEEMRAFIRLTEGRRNLVDVGALFGVFSLVFTRHPDATAYAIEPSPMAFPELLENAALNPGRKIVPLQYFAGAATGEVVACGRDWKHMIANRGVSREGMASTAIDDMPEIAAVDCMKVDVEGFECAVLRGASKTLERFRPILFVECHFSVFPDNQETPEGLFAFLNELGYRVETLTGQVMHSFTGLNAARIICFPK